MRTVVVGSVAAWIVALAAVGAQEPASPIWQGVYTAAQAERGKATFSTACVRCHGSDLAGTTAPSLKGDRFMTAWGGETLNRLFEKIRDTMPPNSGAILDDAAKLDIVAYILQNNGYPAAARELTVGNELASIQIVRQGEQTKVQNFALVQTVGCLAQGENNAWVLRSSADPTVTTLDTPTADALAAAASRPLGNANFRLLSVRPADAEKYRGQKVEARGLIYRQEGDSLLTVTSLKPIGSCS